MGERIAIADKTPEAKRVNSASKTQRLNSSRSSTSPCKHILFLQRTIGNQAVQRLFKSGMTQAKLKIGQPNGIFEQEADRMAEQVMRIPKHIIQHKTGCPECEDNEEETVQPKPIAEQITSSVQRHVEEEKEKTRQPNAFGEALEVTPELKPRINALGDRDQSPPESVRAFLKHSFGYGFNSIGRRMEDAAETRCDIKVHPDDLYKFLMGKSFRTVGKGAPEIKVSDPNLKSKNPCVYEAVMAHEHQHVKNSRYNCQAFKRCVDEKSSIFLGRVGKLLGLEPTIDKDDFGECAKKHDFGSEKNCIEAEKKAYEIGINKAKELARQPKCAKEKLMLKKNIKYWERIKDNAPNCKKEAKKSKTITLAKACWRMRTHVVQQESKERAATLLLLIQRQTRGSVLPVTDWRILYQQCRRQVFGSRDRLSWGSRRVPPLNAVDLILQVTGAGTGGYGPQDLATVWAIERNFVLYPQNHENPNGSVDIGPVQINYQAHSPGMSERRKNAIFGTNLSSGETFNGSPEANLHYGWSFLQRRGHTGYNPGSRARAGAVSALLPELRKFFSYLITARTITFSETEEEPVIGKR